MDKKSKQTLEELTKAALVAPQEQLKEVEYSGNSLTIGIPKEIAFQEKRVALSPNSVKMLVANGHDLVIESGAGTGSNFSDNEYSEAGAKIMYSAKEVYRASSLVLKVAPPTLEEIDFLMPQQTLVSALQLTSQPKETMRKLLSKRIHGIAWDYIQDEDGLFPIVRAMGEIAGNTSILLAAEYLSKPNIGTRAMFGGITGVAPTEVVIFGAGTVGEFATRAAIGLGASVIVFDESIYKLRRLQNDIGMRIKTCIPQPNDVLNALKNADVAIGAVRAKSERTPCIVTEAMVEHMKEGSIIVDVSIDQGGVFETSEVTSHETPIVTKHGVTHYGVPNIASKVSNTASNALSNIFAPILLNFGQHGSFEEVLKKYNGVRNGVYMFNGYLTNQNLSKAFNMPYKDLDLLIAAL